MFTTLKIIFEILKQLQFTDYKSGYKLQAPLGHDFRELPTLPERSSMLFERKHCQSALSLLMQFHAQQHYRRYDTCAFYICPISLSMVWNHSCSMSKAFPPLIRSNSMGRMGFPSRSSSSPMHPDTPAMADATPT
jgi:hypothetical protein